MFQQGDRVTWHTRSTSIPIGEGVVCGIAATKMPLLGCNMIVNVGRIVSDEYPYDTVVIWENWLKLKDES
jgi:hypothetical protein